MGSRSSAESDKWVGNDEWEDVSPQTHRRLLRDAFGAMADTATLADCSQGRSEDTPTPLENEGGGGRSIAADGDSTNQSSGRALDHTISLAPADVRFNPYGNAANFSFRWYWAMFGQLAVHDRVSNKAKGVIVENWECTDNGQIAWDIHDTYTWHNGDDLTAGDVVTQFKVGKSMQAVHKGYGAQPLYENVETTGKYELTFDLVEPDINREIFEFGYMKRRA